MNIQIFPSKEEWNKLHRRLALYTISASVCVGVFWLWYRAYTGAPAVDFYGFPRLCDALALPLFVALLVCSIYFMRHICTRPVLVYKYPLVRPFFDYFGRRIVIPIVLFNTVFGVFGAAWQGASIPAATGIFLLTFVVALLIYGIMTVYLHLCAVKALR